MPSTRFNWSGRCATIPAAYYDDPVIIAVGPDAELWYVRALAWCAAHPGTDGTIPLEVAINRLGIPNAMQRVNICERYGLITKNDDSVSMTPWVTWHGKWHEIQERAAAKPTD